MDKGKNIFLIAATILILLTLYLPKPLEITTADIFYFWVIVLLLIIRWEIKKVIDYSKEKEDDFAKY